MQLGGNQLLNSKNNTILPTNTNGSTRVRKNNKLTSNQYIVRTSKYTFITTIVEPLNIDSLNTRRLPMQYNSPLK